jgi:hypothetical protein
MKDNLMEQILLQGPSRDGLYPIFLSKKFIKTKNFAAFIGVTAISEIWHHRLSHPAPPIINKLKQFAQLPVLGPTSHESLLESCQIAKSKSLPFSESNIVTAEPLEIIHYDLWSSPITSY